MCKDISIEYWSKRKKKRLNYFDIKTKQIHTKTSVVRRKMDYYITKCLLYVAIRLNMIDC